MHNDIFIEYTWSCVRGHMKQKIVVVWLGCGRRVVGHQEWRRCGEYKAKIVGSFEDQLGGGSRHIIGSRLCAIKREAQRTRPFWTLHSSVWECVWVWSAGLHVFVYGAQTMKAMLLD